MNRLALEQKIHDNKQRLKALAAIFDGPSARSLSDEERTEIDAIEAEQVTLQHDLDFVNRQREAERNAPGASDIRVGHDNREDRPWGPPVPANATPQQRQAIVEIGLGAQLSAIAQAGSPGGTVDPRLGPQAAASGQNTGAPSDGGFLVQTEYSNFLLNNAMTSAVLAPLCHTIPIGPGADGLEAPMIDETSRATGSRWGGVRVYRRQETDTVTASKVRFAAWDLRLEDLMAISYASERALQDATSLGATMADAYRAEFAFVIDDEILRGDGNGMCQGILNCNAVQSVAIETGQTLANGGVLSRNLSNMWARIPARSRANVVWFYNQEVEPLLDELSIVAGTGALDSKIVTYDQSGVMRIKGRPVQMLEQCSALGAVGDIFAADMYQYALITKGGLVADESIHVRFIYNERAFRWVTRINGQSKWQAALTPYKGTSGKKLSPFVTLDARS